MPDQIVPVYADTRWIGPHGIGHFAEAVFKRLSWQDLGMKGSPSSPLDPLWMAAKLARLPKEVLVFSPGYNAPIIQLRPYVFTLHDLNHIDVPENGSAAKRLYYQTVLKQACRNASRVLTVSEFSRRRIIEWAGVSQNQVINVGNGVDSVFQPQGECYRPGVPYLLAVNSSRKAHKNEQRLIHAFARASIDDSIHLLFTGQETHGLRALIAECGAEGRVEFLGHIADEDMPALYRGAIALTFPSLYEGFGLPVVEAMAVGTPVLSSTTTAIPEVADDAALLVDPLDVDALAHGIERLANEPELRKRFRERGLERVLQFSWDRVASRVDGVLQEVAAG